MHATRPVPVRERILGSVSGTLDEALLFAASSIINEIGRAEPGSPMVIREVRTARGTYTLQGARVLAGESAQPVIIVHSEPAAPAPSIEDQLRAQFRLTRKEARVALLLAGHKSNEEIARALFISPHTARHHTQSVLGKLGLRSRREVANILKA